jgi:hypothetical protein
MNTLREFITVLRLYRNGGHSITYAARMAWGIAVRGLPF